MTRRKPLRLDPRLLALLCAVGLGACKSLLPKLSLGSTPSTPLQVLDGQGTNGCIDPTGSTSNVDAVTLFAWGGSPIDHYTWTGSDLPPGMILEPATGILKADPNNAFALKAGNYSFSVEVDDGSNTATNTIMVSLSTSSGACGGILFEQSDYDTLQLPDAVAGEPYGSSLYANLGSGQVQAREPLYWSISSGELPPGLAISHADGVIHGKPVSAASGTYTFTTQITDAHGDTAIDPGNGPLVYEIVVQ